MNRLALATLIATLALAPALSHAKGIRYHRVTDRLAQLGVRETPENLTNKVNWGKFGTTCRLQCLEAIDCNVLRIKDE